MNAVQIHGEVTPSATFRQVAVDGSHSIAEQFSASCTSLDVTKFGAFRFAQIRPDQPPSCAFTKSATIDGTRFAASQSGFGTHGIYLLIHEVDPVRVFGLWSYLAPSNNTFLVRWDGVIQVLLSSTLGFAGRAFNSTRRLITNVLGLNFLPEFKANPSRTGVAYVFFSSLLNLSAASPKKAVPRTASSLSFIGSLVRPHNKVLTAALNFVGVFRKSTGRAISGTLSYLGSITIRPPHVIAMQLLQSFLSFNPRSGLNRAFTIDHTKVPTTQTDFTVLVSVTDPTLKTAANGGHVQNSQGFDISFSDSGFSRLKWEIDSYDGVNGILTAWVKIPTLSSVADTIFNLSYGDATITSDQSDPVGTWSNGFLGVWHEGNGTTLNLLSSTGANNGTNHGVTAGAGQISGGGSFVAASVQYIDCGAGINPAAASTLSGWVKAVSFPGAYNSVVGRVVSGSNNVLLVKSTGKLGCFIVTTGGQLQYDGTGVFTLVPGTWYYVAFTYDATNGGKGYVGTIGGSMALDGSFAASGVPNVPPASTRIGSDAVTASREWNGLIDEPRFAGVARSPDWLTIELNNQGSPGTFMAMGPETGTGVFVVTTPSLTRLVTRKLMAATLLFTAVRSPRFLTKFLEASFLSFSAFARGVFHAFTQSLTAALSFIGSITRVRGKLFQATLNFTVGTFRRFTSRIQPSTLAFIGQMGVSRKKLLQAVLSFIGSISKQRNKLITAALSFIGSINAVKPLVQIMTATLSFIGNAFKRRPQRLTAALSFIGSHLRLPGKKLTAAVSFIGGIKRRIPKRLLAVLSFIGSLKKKIPQRFSSALSFIGDIATDFTHGASVFFQDLFATLSFIGAQKKQIPYRMAGAVSFASSYSKRALLKFRSHLFSIGDLYRTIPRHLSAALSFIGKLTSPYPKKFVAAISFVGKMFKSRRKTLAGALSFLGAISRLPRKRLTAHLDFIGLIRRSFKLAQTHFTATLDSHGIFRRRAGRALQGSVHFAGKISRRASHLLSSVLNFVSVITWYSSHVGEHLMSLAATLDLHGARFTKDMSRRITATLSLISKVTRSLPVKFLAAIRFAVSFPRSIRPWRYTSHLDFIGEMGKRMPKFMASILDLSGSIRRRRMAILLVATLSSIGATSRSVFRELASSLSFITGLSHVFARFLSGTLKLKGRFWKQPQLSVASVLSFLGQVGRGIPVQLESTLYFVSILTKRVGQQLAAVLSFITGFIRDSSGVDKIIKIIVGVIAPIFLKVSTFVEQLIMKVSTEDSEEVLKAVIPGGAETVLSVSPETEPIELRIAVPPAPLEIKITTSRSLLALVISTERVTPVFSISMLQDLKQFSVKPEEMTLTISVMQSGG